MVRPFFKWMVSADAAAAASTNQIIAKLVTRDPIEAHSSNGGPAHLRDESTKEPFQIRRGAGGLHRFFSVCRRLRRAIPAGIDTPAWTSGSALSATE